MNWKQILPTTQLQWLNLLMSSRVGWVGGAVGGRCLVVDNTFFPFKFPAFWLKYGGDERLQVKG